MGTLLSKSSKDAGISEVDRAILALKAQRKKLDDQRKLLELRIEQHTEVARQLVVEKKKDRALLVLKKKKLVEGQLSELGGLILNLETTIMSTEGQKQQNKLFQVLKQGNDALQQLQKEVTVEDVQKLMDDTAEARAYQEQIEQALAQSTGGLDEEELEHELGALEEQVLAAEVAEMPKAPEVPAGATKVPAQAAAGKAGAEPAEEEGPAPAREALLAS